MSEGSFERRVAVVTGAGAGLGRAYALELARRGAAVVVNDLGGAGRGGGSSSAAADSVVADITAAGGQAMASYESVATRRGGAAIIRSALDHYGRVDILISNAGILRTGRFDEMSDDDIDTVLDVHLRGSFYVAQPAFTAMKQQGYGRILFTASSSGLFGHPWQASYAAAKAGIAGLANVVALEGKEYGILCNVILPSARTRLADEIDWRWAKEATDVGAVLAQLSATADGSERLGEAWVMPLALHLVGETCTSTQGIFSACNGRYARVFVGAAHGWLAQARPTVEDIAAHWAEICDPAEFSEPHSVYDEALAVRTRIASNS